MESSSLEWKEEELPWLHIWLHSWLDSRQPFHTPTPSFLTPPPPTLTPLGEGLFRLSPWIQYA